MSDTELTVAANFNTAVLNKVNSAATHIELFYQGAGMSLSKSNLPKLMGRDEDSCDIVVKSNVASRVHCSLDVQDNQIGIADKSTNGTFIEVGRAESFVIKNKFYPLVGQGRIKLGSQFDDNDAHVIHFRTAIKNTKD
jgi:hypothetical protein